MGGARRISDQNACLVYAERVARGLEGESTAAIRARVLAELGNAYRNLEQLREGAKCFAWAEKELEGTDDQIVYAELSGLALEGAMRVRPLFNKFAPPFQRNAINWQCARLLFGQGRLDSAESLYRSVFRDYLSLGRKLQAAILGLDICMVLVRRRELDGMKVRLGAAGLASLKRHSRSAGWRQLFDKK